ncbi:zinc finger, C3HC4 type, partial [Ancylostoma ceylanicum]
MSGCEMHVILLLMQEFDIGPLGDWQGTAKVVVKSGNIVEEKVDVICVSVGSTLQHSDDVYNALVKAGGRKAYKTAYEKARGELTNWLSRGEILIVDTSDTKLEAKYVFLVVHPDVFHLEDAYRNIFREAMARGCTSVAIPGLGCECEENPHKLSFISRTKSFSRRVTYHDEDDAGTGSDAPQKIVFIDMKEKVAQQFIAQMEAKFGIMDSAEALNSPSNSMENFAKPPTYVQQDDCVICLCPLSESSEVSELPCKHQLHTACLKEYLRSANVKKRCPVCLRYFELPLGDQPSEARMFINKLNHIKLPGHEDSDFVYEIIYSVPNGIQEASHIRPGRPFTGTHRRAYVPGTAEGTK